MRTLRYDQDIFLAYVKDDQSKKKMGRDTIDSDQFKKETSRV